MQPARAVYLTVKKGIRELKAFNECARTAQR